MNELDAADQNLGESPHGDVILICDPTREGESIAQALRDAGYVVPTARLPIIEVRILEESPRLLLIDIDQPAAVETIERMRELPDGAALTLVCFGSSARADELRGGYGKCFARPVHMGDLIAYIQEHADPNQKAKNTQPSVAPPPMSQRAPDTVPPATRDSESPEPEEREPNADPFDIGAILSTGGPTSPAPSLPTQLSPELEQLMLSAERRVGSDVRSSTVPPPEEEEELILPAELLSALDEPFDIDDESGTGPGPAMTTRSLALAKRNQQTNPHHVAAGTGVNSPREPVGDSSQGTPAETDPMQPSRSVRSYQFPPSSVGVPSRRGRHLDEDTANEGPISREAVTPVERRQVVSTRPADLQRSRQQSPPQAPSHADPSLRRPEPLEPPMTSASRDDMRTLAPTRPARPTAPTPPSPLSIAPGSMYSTSSASRGHAETSRPASTISAMTEATRRPPTTAASPAPMPVSVRTTSRFSSPYAAAGPPPGSQPGAPPYASSGPKGPPPAPPPIRRTAPSPPPAPPAPTRKSTPPPEPPRPAPPELAPVIGEGDAALVLAQAIGGRATGALAITTDGCVRRVVLHDGDVTIAASSAPGETLLAFLAARGDIDRDVAARFENKLPPFGRHAGAALIAHGHLGQDDLWPVLRAHAEWIIGRVVLVGSGSCELESDPPGRLKAEPNVFGGATGAEVLIETVRRVVSPEAAMRRVGGPGARVSAGPRGPILSECALRREEEDLIRAAQGRPVAEIIGATEPEFVTVLYALACLGVIELYAAPAQSKPDLASEGVDPLDEEAVRQRVRARLALVEDGDYFSLIGVARTATSYEVRRAYLELRRTFEPARLLTARTADLHGDVRLVIEVLDEAYDILREPHRRERYRKAIESPGPA